MKQVYRLMCIFLTLALLASTVAGCAKKPVSAQSSAAPKSAVAKGYYEQNQGLSGGKDMQNINLRDIKVERDSKNGDTILTLSFVTGSLQLGMDEQPTDGVPKYSTQWLDGVDRLVLNMDGLSYWDFEVIPEEIADTPILGVVKQSMENAERTRLFINLRSGIAYQAREEGNKLVITIRALPVDDSSKYYIELNAMDELTSGKLDEKEGFLPTLCSDKASSTLISAPFDTNEAAQARLEEVKKNLLPNLPGKSAIIVQVKGGELPRYDAQGALDVFSNTPVFRRDGKEQTADIVLTNGTVLCWRPDGQAYVYASPFFLGDTSDTTSYVKLYLFDVAANKATLLSDFEYNDILAASFSEDGRYVAFIDQGEQSQVLYIKDTQAPVDDVDTASEAGMGVDTCAFCWGNGEAANMIYAISGEKDQLQLMSYKVNAGGEAEVKTLVEEEFTIGSIGYFNGKVYYSQSSDDAEKTGVFVFDPEKHTTNRLSDGYSFVMNRKNGTLAILINEDTSEDVNSYMLKLYNPSDNSETVVLDNKDMGDDIVWSIDGTKLFFTVYYDNVATDERYKMALWRYDTGTNDKKELMDIAEGSLEPADRSSDVLLTYIFNQANQFVPITYKLTE